MNRWLATEPEKKPARQFTTSSGEGSPAVTGIAVRVVATRTLFQVIDTAQSLAHVLPSALDQVSGRDRTLLQECCYGTLRWYPRLRSLLSLLLNKPLKGRAQQVEILLLVSLYQLLYLRIPDYAVVSAAVAAVRTLGQGWAAALVNGVLRNFQRRREALLTNLEQDDIARYAHPSWMLQRFRRDWPADWQVIVETNNAHPPQSLRVNLTRLSRQFYLEKLTDAGMEAIPHPMSAAAITLNQPYNVDDLPGFHQGLVSIQDPGAQLAAELLELRPGLRVLDACAAPGGKTCHMLEQEPGLAHLLALDSDAQRLCRVQDNLSRLGLKACTAVGDALTPSLWWDDQPYDRILLDAPCSATGVIRRHPDIKLLRKPADIRALADRQYAMLQRLWPLLAPGGILVYATCSILREENEDIVAKFLATRADIQEQIIIVPWGRARLHGRQIVPGEWAMDGFYYSRFIKNA